MPRPHAPPTPGSSNDIRGKEGSIVAPTFNLPPTAFQDDRASTSSTSSANGSDSSYRPASPPSPAELSRKKQVVSGPVITKEDFALPPPPTRSRKIIQMKPRDLESQDALAAVSSSPQTAGRPQSGGQGGSKKKQSAAGANAAGRKIARKTAHSLIERRRRSKMNEEFGVLKDMIPACVGQEMHKLSILQASIEYLRYLEKCVTDLQAQNNSPRPPPPQVAATRDSQEEEDEEDEEMEDDDPQTAASTPATAGMENTASNISLPSLSQMTSMSTMSPSVFSTNAGRHYSISSTSQASYSPYFHSNQTSPAFGPQLAHIHSAPSQGVFGLGSPALRPLDSAHHLRQIADGASDLADKRRAAKSSNAGRSEEELDNEATAALLMLNNDRRQWRSSQTADGGRGPGMSVHDLLTG